MLTGKDENQKANCSIIPALPYMGMRVQLLPEQNVFFYS